MMREHELDSRRPEFFRISVPMIPVKIIPLLLFPLFGALGAAVNPACSDEIYELHGFFGRDDKLEVSIRDSRNDAARWFRVGKKSGGVVIEKADAKSGTVTLLIDGVRRELKLAVEAPSQALFPATLEELQEFMNRFGELCRRPGVLAKIRALHGDAEARFDAEHPEFSELKRRMIDEPEDDSPERRELAARYNALDAQYDDFANGLSKASGDPDLIEAARLCAAMNDVRKRLPAELYSQSLSVVPSQPAEAETPPAASPVVVEAPNDPAPDDTPTDGAEK